MQTECHKVVVAGREVKCVVVATVIHLKGKQIELLLSSVSNVHNVSVELIGLLIYNTDSSVTLSGA